MRTAPFLLAAALLFWGWQTGHLLWSAVMGTALEGSRYVRRRWEFSDIELRRIWLLCLALSGGAALVLFSTEDRMLFVFKFAQSLPVCAFPLILAQAYGSRADIPIATFSWPLPARAGLSGSINLSYHYFALCIVGTSASTQANSFFFEGMAVLIVVALTVSRPRRVGLRLWAALLVLALIGGFYSQQELRRLQSALEGALGGLIADMFHQPVDARECRTSIGHPGEIPHSGKIMWRLTPEDGSFAPPLLRQAVYQSYRDGTWSSSSTNDYSPAPRRGLEMFRLLPDKPVAFAARLGGYYSDGAGPLAIPHGCFELTEVASPGQALTNRFGCVELNNAPGLVECVFHWGPGASLDPPPENGDRYVTETERPTLDRIVASLDLGRLTERQKIRAVAHFFSEGFAYSLEGSGRREPRKTPLGIFLTETKSGHCEYFATATVLLLRRAGIPARYATGYAVPDNARQGKTFFIRERHAHAWVLVFHADTHTWEELDTTPGAWATAAEIKPPWWEPASDFASNLYYRFSEWRWGRTSLARYAPWLMVPLILTLTWRIVAAQRGRAIARTRAKETAPSWPGLDSELYKIDQRLTSAELSRRPSETLALWQRRLETAPGLPHRERLQRIFALHRALRFDPKGLSHPDRVELKEEAERWLSDFSVQNPKSQTGRLRFQRKN